jgi:hypothetical protein
MLQRLCDGGVPLPTRYKHMELQGFAHCAKKLHLDNLDKPLQTARGYFCSYHASPITKF